MQNFYQLLSVEPIASREDIKKAFRAEIARYHPDKVQHLGKEFQEMAATRAAMLTEAYRTLMNAELRSEYDRLYVGIATASPTPFAPASPKSPASSSSSSSSSSFSSTTGATTSSSSSSSPSFSSLSSSGSPGSPASAAHPRPPQGHASEDASADAEQRGRAARFAPERATRDEFVRKAALGRFRQALAAEVGVVQESAAKGFDLDCATRAKGLFSRNGGQRFVLKLVPRVDRAAVQEAWVAASQKGDLPVCVFLVGNSVAPAAELGDAIAEMRKKTRGATRISIIPVDVRDWSAHVPADAPTACKKDLQRLRESAP